MPVDAEAGAWQEYVEDCPVCCSPVVLSVSIEDDGEVRIVARPE